MLCSYIALVVKIGLYIYNSALDGNAGRMAKRMGMIECCFVIIFICASVAAMAIYYKETIILWMSTSETEENLINLNGDGIRFVVESS